MKMGKHGKYSGSTKSSSMPVFAKKNHEYKEKLQLYLEKKFNDSNKIEENNDSGKKKKKWKKKSDTNDIQELELDGFDINNPPLKNETLKTTKKGQFTYQKYEAHKEFICDRCTKNKKSKNIIIWHDITNQKTICNGCYGELIKDEKKK
jgi:hypothetical protein